MMMMRMRMRMMTSKPGGVPYDGYYAELISPSRPGSLLSKANSHHHPEYNRCTEPNVALIRRLLVRLLNGGVDPRELEQERKHEVRIILKHCEVCA